MLEWIDIALCFQCFDGASVMGRFLAHGRGRWRSCHLLEWEGPVKRLLGVLIAAAAVMAAPATAYADLLGVGDSLNINFFQAANPPTQANDLEAELTLTVINISTTEAIVELALSNTTVGIGNILSVGFATDPNATGVSGATTGGPWDPLTDTDKFEGFTLESIPSLNFVEVCAYPSNNCSGGNVNNGLLPGETDVFRMTLAGTWGSQIDFSGFGIKFQGAPESFEFAGDGDGGSSDGDGGTSDGDGGTVPEPATLALLGLAFGAAGMRMRRRVRV